MFLPKFTSCDLASLLRGKKSWADAVLLFDGSEILAPVEFGRLSHSLQGFIHPRWLFGISEPSALLGTLGLPKIPAAPDARGAFLGGKKNVGILNTVCFRNFAKP